MKELWCLGESAEAGTAEVLDSVLLVLLLLELLHVLFSAGKMTGCAFMGSTLNRNTSPRPTQVKTGDTPFLGCRGAEDPAALPTI